VKILHVIDSGGLYGAEIMLLSLMEEQLRQGNHPVLASIGDPEIAVKPIEAEAERRGLQVKSFRMRPGPNVIGAYEVLRFAWQEKADILHSHGYKGNILFGFLPRFVRRVPMVSTLHGWTWSGGMTRMRIYEWLDSLSLSFVDRVITVNAIMKNHPRIKSRQSLALEVVPNGIPLCANEPQKEVADLNPDIIDFCRQGYTIGAIGRLSPEKGFESLLGVVATLAGQGKDIRLVILGEGGLRSRLETATKDLGIEKNVRMPGYVRDAKRYIPFFNLFAMPSLTEGLPIVLLEAMQAAVPIVASRVGGIPEVLQDGMCGALIEPGSQESLLLRIQNAINNPDEAAQRVCLARKRVIAVYSSQLMAEKYLEIYKRVLQ